MSSWSFSSSFSSSEEKLITSKFLAQFGLTHGFGDFLRFLERRSFRWRLIAGLGSLFFFLATGMQMGGDLLLQAILLGDQESFLHFISICTISGTLIVHARLGEPRQAPSFGSLQILLAPAAKRRSNAGVTRAPLFMMRFVRWRGTFEDRERDTVNLCINAK